MIFELLERDPVFRIQSENFVKQVRPKHLLLFRFKDDLWFIFLYIFHEVEALATFNLYIIQNVDSFKREIAAKKVVKKDTQRPNISLFIIFHAGKNFRGHVSLGSAVGDGSPTF